MIGIIKGRGNVVGEKRKAAFRRLAMWLSNVDPIAVLPRHGIFTLLENEKCGQGPWARF